MPSTGQRTLDTWLARRPAPNASSSSSHRSRSRFHPNGRSSSGFRQSSQSSQFPHHQQQNYRRNTELAAVATETRQVLPDILQKLPNIHANKSEALFIDSLPPLKASECPKRTPTGTTKIKIVSDDSYNAAIALGEMKAAGSGRVAVLNMASERSPGGGWLKGARAQEEALCYRSSLALSLHKRYYPWKQRMGLYTPDVLIIRSDMASGHKLLYPDTKAEDLAVVSVLGIAAVRRPPLAKVLQNKPDGTVEERAVYANPADRVLTKVKMRLCLRMAARRNHGLLVLGALGCGAFKNPTREVAHCWLEVLQENEFKGGWWEEVWFAVYDKKHEGNLEVFEEVLGDVEI